MDMEKEDNTLEFKLRGKENPWPKTRIELDAFLDELDLDEDSHTYGSCVYAMSLAAVAAYNLVASLLGVTGFQAGCAKMDVLKRLGGYKRGFQVLDMNNLMFPQYLTDDKFPTIESLMRNPNIRKQLRHDATLKLKEETQAHEDVIQHWKMLSELPVLDQEAEDGVTLYED